MLTHAQEMKRNTENEVYTGFLELLKPRIWLLWLYKSKHILKTDGASTFDSVEEWSMCTPGCSSSVVTPITRLPAIVTRQQTTPAAGMMPSPTVEGGCDQS